MYSGVGEVRQRDGECVGEKPHGEHVADGGDSVCCVTEERCCSPFVCAVARDGELCTGLVWMESDFKEDKEEDETEERVDDTE